MITKIIISILIKKRADNSARFKIFKLFTLVQPGFSLELKL